MNVLKIMHPESRRLERVKEHRLSDGAYAGWGMAPWDCVCDRVCACSTRPMAPPPGREEEAVADLHKRIAAFAAAGLIAPVEILPATPEAVEQALAKAQGETPDDADKPKRGGRKQKDG